MLLLLTIAMLSQTPASYQSSLKRAADAYAQADFDQALARLVEAEDVVSNDTERCTLLLYRGVVLANVPHPEAAAAAWEQALTLNPDAVLPLPVSAKVRTQFESIQRTVQRLRKSLQPAVTAAAPTNPAPALSPALQPRWVVSGISLGLGVVSAVVGAGLGGGASSTIDKAKAVFFADERRTLYAEAQQQALWANIGFGAALTFTVTAVLLYFLWPKD